MSVVRSSLFVMAVVLLLLAAGFRLDDAGAHWLWADRPAVAVVLVLAALALGTLQVVRVTRRR